MGRWNVSDDVVGRRVRLIYCTDVLTPLDPGLEGTVSFVDGLGTVHVEWDNGTRLGLVPDMDAWMLLP